jgi:hypothetical protein
MKPVIAYSLVIIGVTQLVGLWAGSAIILPIARVVPYALKVRVLPLLEFFNGVAALATAIVLFWLLNVSIPTLLPLIVGAWFTFYFFSYGQSNVAWFAAIAGVIACWVVYRIAFAP